MNISDDSYAMLLLCSDLALRGNDSDIKSYTVSQWSNLAERLVDKQLTPKDLFDISSNRIKSKLALTDDEAIRIEKLLSRSGPLSVELSSLGDKGISVLTRFEKAYPVSFKNKLKKQAPPVLYYSGNIALLKNKGVSIVGSRDIDQVGVEFTERLSRRCTNDGLNIISGGARGVDSIAEKAANESDGTTIIVVADSMERKIRNSETREAIVKNQSLILSPFRPDMPFQTFAAMERNKYVYALADFVVIVSSEFNKGGTWAGATENIRKNWVPMFVRKADPMPSGNTKLLLKENVYTIDEQVINDSTMNIFNWFSTQINNKDVDASQQQLSLFN